jgi:hypothetical protein
VESLYRAPGTHLEGTTSRGDHDGCSKGLWSKSITGSSAPKNKPTSLPTGTRPDLIPFRPHACAPRITTSIPLNSAGLLRCGATPIEPTPHPPSSPQAGVSWHARLGLIRLAIRSHARGRGMITINDTIVVRRSAFVPYSGWSYAGETRTIASLAKAGLRRRTGRSQLGRTAPCMDRMSSSIECECVGR